MTGPSIHSQVGASRAEPVHDYSELAPNPIEHYRTLMIAEPDHLVPLVPVQGSRSRGRTQWSHGQFEATVARDVLGLQPVTRQRRNAISSQAHQLTHALIENRLLEAFNQALARRLNQVEAQLREHTVASHLNSSVADAPCDVLQDKLAHLEKLAGLRPDWDSYGADPPSARAIAVAARIIVGAWGHYRGSDPSSVLPWAIIPLSGGIQLEWHAPGAALEIEIDAQGEIGYLAEHGVDPNRQFEEGDNIPYGRAIELAVKLFGR